MKKAFSLVLIVAFILTVLPCVAYADDKNEHIDVSKLKDEELLSYYFDMQEELLVRGLDASKQIKLTQGNYTVGYDIPAAYYNLICVRTLDDDTQNTMDAIDTYFSAFGLGKLGDLYQGVGNAIDMVGTITVNILSDSGETVKTFDLTRGKIVKITLEDNQIIQVSAGAISLNPVE